MLILGLKLMIRALIKKAIRQHWHQFQDVRNSLHGLAWQFLQMIYPFLFIKLTIHYHVNIVSVEMRKVKRLIFG